MIGLIGYHRPSLSKIPPMFLAAVIAIIGKASWPFGAPIITAVLEHTFRRILFQQPREEDEERKEKKEAFHKKRDTDLTRSQ
jgi:hypothetical protein